MSRSRSRAISTSRASRSGSAGPILTRVIESGWLASAAAFFARDLIDPVAVHLVRGKLKFQTLAHYAGKKAAHRMLLPSGRFHDGGDRCARRRLQHRNDARLLRAIIPLV